MALIFMNLYSRCLQRSVPITALIPIDSARLEEEPLSPIDKPFKTLYLLNGFSGGSYDWLINAQLAQISTRYNIAIILPAGENKFYVDNAATGEGFGRYIGEELVEQTRRLFPLSHNREDTFIGGMSMGGYGALRNGIRYADTFGFVVALSSGIVDDKFYQDRQERIDKLGEFAKYFGYANSLQYLDSIFGGESSIPGSDNDLKHLVLNRKSKQQQLPRIYMACGTEDLMLSANHRYRDFLLQENVDFIFEEGPGAHDFTFWGSYLQRALTTFLMMEK